MGIITEGLPLNEPENHGVVQDLLWVWNAPPLMAFEANWLPQNELGRLNLEALTPDQLARLRLARQGKLGAYFEALVCALVECSDHYRVLARGVIIQGSERTLGELDVLIQHQQSGETVHLELALKFYLAVPDTASATWIGPGLRDFLRLKYHHLRDQQLTLPDRARQASVWPGQLPFPDRSMPWVTGRLYYPWQMQPTGEDPLLEPGHRYSHWLTLSDFQSLDFNSQWLKKAHWLSGPAKSTLDKPTHGLPAQCFGSPRNGQEQDKAGHHWFIVPDDWPERARISILQRFG